MSGQNKAGQGQVSVVECNQEQAPTGKIPEDSAPSDKVMHQHPSILSP
jgi:hypothetical protein